MLEGYEEIELLENPGFTGVWLHWGVNGRTGDYWEYLWVTGRTGMGTECTGGLLGGLEWGLGALWGYWEY